MGIVSLFLVRDSLFVFGYYMTMLSHLTGKIIHKDASYFVIDVNGVGYKVYTTGNMLGKMKSNEMSSLWIHNAIRETANDLYGFLTREELEFFELLITISGIGPKTALGILNVANIETLKQAVRSGNSGHLTKISGIGKKNAEKIVIELSGKLGTSDESGLNIKDEGDAIEALTALGYSQKEARDALREIPNDIVGTGERVKKALKHLGKQ